MISREQFFRNIFAALLSSLPAGGSPRKPRIKALRRNGKRPVNKIDAWSHAIGRNHMERLRALPEGPHSLILRVIQNTPELFDTDARFRTMDRFGGYKQILTPVPALHLAIAAANPSLSTELVQFSNDSLAELVAKHSDRFAGFAAVLPMHDPEAVLRELDRVLRTNALGVQVETNIGGVPLDDQRFEPFFSRMANEGKPVWVHPFRFPGIPDYAAEKGSRYLMWQALGWPCDTAIALSRLILSGYLERLPGLTLVGHHGGGMVPHFSGRLGRQLEVWGPKLDPDLAATLPKLTKPVLEYFRMLYVDTALSGAPHAVECAIKFFGADHVFFGTDSPFDPAPGEFVQETISDVEATQISDSDKSAIFSGNTMRILLGGKTTR